MPLHLVQDLAYFSLSSHSLITPNEDMNVLMLKITYEQKTTPKQLVEVQWPLKLFIIISKPDSGSSGLD